MTRSPSDIAKPVLPKGYDQVMDFLTSQLMDGSLRDGDRLLSERDLAVRLGISRPIVREALRSLAMLGVLEIRQGHGTFVRTPDASNLGQLFAFMIAQKGSITDDITEVRVALERQAVRLACERGRPADFERLERACERVAATIADPVEGGKADYEFHTALVQASHSPALIMIYGIVSLVLQSSHVARRHRWQMTPEQRAMLIASHEQIMRALRDRNSDRSEALLSSHLVNGPWRSSGADGEADDRAAVLTARR